MIVVVREGSIEVREADDLRHLSVRSELDGLALDRALRDAGWGHLEGAEASIALEPLHRNARASASRPGWDESWRHLVDYAAERGWLVHGGAAVRAHLEQHKRSEPVA